MTLASSQDLPGGSFNQLVAPHRQALLGHCYRMTGSLHDAEDALQETLLRAWRSFDSFEGRSSVRTWLFTIATNACRRLIEQRGRRVLPVDLGPPSDPYQESGPTLEESRWVTPFPGGAEEVSPAARYESKESVELAFVAALQLLPGRQRAALLLRDVLGFSAAETAVALESSVASVNSALQRARQAVAARLPQQSQQQTLRSLGDVEAKALVERFVAAWERGDVDALVRLLSEDVELSMPPQSAWFRGVSDVSDFLRRVPLAAEHHWHGVPVEANGQLAFAVWLDSGSGWEPHGINVLTLTGDKVSGIGAFRFASLVDAFGLPSSW